MLQLKAGGTGFKCYVHGIIIVKLPVERGKPHEKQSL